MPTVRAGKGENGYALFFVLSLILLLSLLLTGVTRDSRQQAKAALRSLEAAQSRAGAETVLSLSLMHLLAATPEDRWNADGSAHALTIDEKQWRIAVTPEDGKVDLNHAPAPLLTELFTAAGLSQGEAQALADRVLDWRDEDDLTHASGAEKRAYDAAALPPPRNGPFLGPQEIRQVMGMTEDLYRCIADSITVYSGKASIDRRHAPPMLRATSGNPKTAAAVSVAASPLAFETLAGRALSIEIIDQSGSRSHSNKEAIVRLSEHPQQPFWLLAGRDLHSRDLSSVEKTCRHSRIE